MTKCEKDQSAKLGYKWTILVDLALDNFENMKGKINIYTT